MKTLALVLALGAALLLPEPGRAAEKLRDFTQRVLVHAPQNFAALRGAERSRASYQIEYGRAASVASWCDACKIFNEFAWPHHAENWYLSDDWHAPKSWSHARTASYALKQVTPLLTGFARATSGTHDYPTYRWTNAAKREWVVVDTFNGGFTLKVGHDLAGSSPAHTLHALSLDDAQTMRNAVGNVLKLAVGGAADNFATLRGPGKRNALGTMEYKLAVDFGPALYDCSVSDNTENVLKLGDFSPNWSLDCSTTPAYTSVSALEDQVKQAVTDALPSSFTSTTGKLVGLNDFRWDNDQNVAVTVGSLSGMFLPEGLAEIRVGITHFVQNP
ncbi:MAG: hypothetical protein KGN02_03660 [bacterium]|nr:hypothetical protein [bacterium]